MRYGVTVPNIGELELLLTMGREAEAAGWDGFFLWDHIRFSDAFDVSVHDPWVAWPPSRPPRSGSAWDRWSRRSRGADRGRSRARP